ncbi:hypothetical protein [Oerskovia rustica]|uniref:Uncharacterized protein n=1 Tax=Oerskovia rustica TaxID=2762237 RepID=A0ABR8RX46_9CELL|nr:hypothetical protein [Oerskovia rustica]MBD7952371.1 hypothetical protein [Oerskovia rustica]
MASVKKDHDEFRAISGRIRATSPLLDRYIDLGEVPTWYDYALSDIALLVSADEIRHVDSEFTADDTQSNAQSARIVIFTDTLIIDVIGSFDGKIHERTVTARKRVVTSLGVQAGDKATGNDEGARIWPGRLKIRFQLATGEVYSLPLTTESTFETRASLLALLSALREDLARG